MHDGTTTHRSLFHKRGGGSFDYRPRCPPPSQPPSTSHVSLIWWTANLVVCGLFALTTVVWLWRRRRTPRELLIRSSYSSLILAMLIAVVHTSAPYFDSHGLHFWASCPGTTAMTILGLGIVVPSWLELICSGRRLLHIFDVSRWWRLCVESFDLRGTLLDLSGRGLRCTRVHSIICATIMRVVLCLVIAAMWALDGGERIFCATFRWPLPVLLVSLVCPLANVNFVRAVRRRVSAATRVADSAAVTIAALPTRRVDAAEARAAALENALECSICLSDLIEAGQLVTTLPCGHEFHQNCIIPWLHCPANNRLGLDGLPLRPGMRSCPLCKREVAPPPDNDPRSNGNAATSSTSTGTGGGPGGGAAPQSSSALSSSTSSATAADSIEDRGNYWA
jgi:hypothetical protein